MTVAAWVSQEADSEAEIRVQGIFRGLLLQYQHLRKGREGKEREGRKTGQRGKSGCNAVFFFFSFFNLGWVRSQLWCAGLVALQHVGS